MNNQWILPALLALALGGACKGTGAEGPASGAAGAKPAEQAAEPNSVRVAPDVQKKWGVDVAALARTELVGAITVPGTLSLDPRHTAQISSLLDGQVTFVGVQVGDAVRPRQVLVTLHAPALAQAKTAYLQAGARLELTRREFERADALLKQEAIDQKEHLRRRTELQSASSEFAVAESNLHSYGLDQASVDQLLRQARRPDDGKAAMDDLTTPFLPLTSPIGGRVIDEDVVVGQHVEPQKTLLTVSDLSTLWALLDAREADLPHVAPNGEVRITTTVYPGREWRGRVDHVGDVVDEKTRTVKVRVLVRNDDRALKPNMYIQGEFPNAIASKNVLAVPEEAIQTIGGEPVVFVKAGADRFVARPVEVGEKVGTRRVVLKGLEGSETVVIAGAFNLKAELLKSTLAGE